MSGTVRRAKPGVDSTEGVIAGTIGPEPAEPRPGATERKKESLKIEKPSRPRKLLNEEELKDEEAKLKDRYPHIIDNTLLNATKDQTTEGLTADEVTKFRHKRSVIIACTCGVQRRIATSDLAQVTLCVKCTTDERNRRKRERRAAARNAAQTAEPS